MRNCPHDLGLSAGNGSGFIKDDRVHMAGVLKGFTVFDEYSHSCAASHSYHYRCRRCKSERTRAGNYKHGNHYLDSNTDGFACKQPDERGNDGYYGDGWNKNSADLIRKPCDGCFTALSLLDHSNHSGKHGIIADTFGYIDKAAVHVNASADDAVADILVNGNAFAAQHRFVNAAVTFHDLAVNRNAFARQDSYPFSDHDLISVDHLFAAVLKHDPCGIRG